MSDPARLSAQMNGMSISNPFQASAAEGHHYPPVPLSAPGYNAAAPGYPAPASYATAPGGPPSHAPQAYHAVAPAGGGYAASGNGYAMGAPNSLSGMGSMAQPHSGPVTVGSGWTTEAVKPESTQPGQNTAGHYGHLQ
jgi:hypothetical protein